MPASEGAVLGLGNPIVDVVAEVDSDFLVKWNLRPNVLNKLGPQVHAMEKDLLERYQARNLVGGSVQNTLRTIQWLFGFRVKN